MPSTWNTRLEICLVGRVSTGSVPGARMLIYTSTYRKTCRKTYTNTYTSTHTNTYRRTYPSTYPSTCGSTCGNIPTHNYRHRYLHGDPCTQIQQREVSESQKRCIAVSAFACSMIHPKSTPQAEPYNICYNYPPFPPSSACFA